MFGYFLRRLVGTIPVLLAVSLFAFGFVQQVAVRTLTLHDDLGLCKEPTTYPSFPDLRFYRRAPRPVRSQPEARTC
jgi:hypothetical protein